MAFIKKYQSYIFFLLVVLVLIIRVLVDSTNYRTPDSLYYLEAANNMVNGLGPVGPGVIEKDIPFGHPELYTKEYFAVWPLGYPACIALVSFVTSLEPLWSSKLLNIILLAIDFYLIGLIFGRKFNLGIFYFGSYTMIEICSYTWSENLFLPFFLLLVYALTKVQNNISQHYNTIFLIAISLIGMCLARYASVVFFGIPFAIFIYNYLRNESAKAKAIFWGMTISSIVLGVYLSINFLQTGYLTGMPRINTQEYSSFDLIKKLFTGIFNQMHIIKQYRISGFSDYLFYIGAAALQLVLIFYVWFAIRKKRFEYQLAFANRILLYSGLLYLLFLICMTFTITIDPFDYRTLTPFSFPLILVLLNEVEKKLVETKKENVIGMIKLFFVFSLLINLPKKQAIEWILHL